jgi:hypothetical protein
MLNIPEGKVLTFVISLSQNAKHRLGGGVPRTDGSIGRRQNKLDRLQG